MKTNPILDGVTRPRRGQPVLAPAELNPSRHSPLGVQNRIRIQVVGPDKNGSVVTKHDRVVEGNIMCTYGLSELARLLAGGSMNCSEWIGGMRIGTDGTAASSTDSRLGHSVASVDLTDANDVITTSGFPRVLRCVATFSSNNPAGTAEIKEVGIYASSNVTTGLVARRHLTGAESVNKGESDSIMLSYDIEFTTRA